MQWADAFDRKSDVVSNHVEVSADSQLLAIAVKRLAGGSRFLDISQKLKTIRIIVYRAKSGKRVLEYTANPSPSSNFDFALSPEGDSLAVVSDGFLEIVPLER